MPGAPEQLGVECSELVRVLDRKAAITAKLAPGMESVWHSRARLWLDPQTDCDLAEVPCRNAAENTSAKQPKS